MPVIKTTWPFLNNVSAGNFSELLYQCFQFFDWFTKPVKLVKIIGFEQNIWQRIQVKMQFFYHHYFYLATKMLVSICSFHGCLTKYKKQKQSLNLLWIFTWWNSARKNIVSFHSRPLPRKTNDKKIWKMRKTLFWGHCDLLALSQIKNFQKIGLSNFRYNSYLTIYQKIVKAKTKFWENASPDKT